jgi:hypothetical protein
MNDTTTSLYSPVTLALMAEVTIMFHNEEAAGFEIKDEASREYAVQLLQKVKTAAAEVTEDRLALTRPIDAQKKQIMDEVRPFLNACSEFEAKTKKAITSFLRAQEEARREAEAKAAAKERKARERLEKRAATAMDRGEHEKADALLDKALSTTAPVDVPAPVKVSGQSSRETFAAEVSDKVAFLRAAVDNPALLECVDINQGKLNKLAGFMKAAFCFPGVKLVRGSRISIRR